MPISPELEERVSAAWFESIPEQYRLTDKDKGLCGESIFKRRHHFAAAAAFADRNIPYEHFRRAAPDPKTASRKGSQTKHRQSWTQKSRHHR